MSNSVASDLQIAGLVPLSTVDWPDKLVATVFCQGCPWACEYCHNHDIIDPTVAGVVPWQKVDDLLKRRKGLLDGVVFSGGEALRQAALFDAAQIVKGYGFSVGLHTAGPYPRALRQMLDRQLVDWVGLDIKATVDNYPRVVGRPHSGEKAWECLDIMRQSECDYEVRLTVFPDGPHDELDVARQCKEKGVHTFALQQARSEGAPEGFQASAQGWDDHVQRMVQAIDKLGFDNFIFRPA